MGAGDAFFCVTAPFAAAGASMPELLEIGNAAGAIKCGVVGHREAVTKAALMAYLNP
jgi:sugar/nucleoside kinase (ribokinase family)